MLKETLDVFYQLIGNFFGYILVFVPLFLVYRSYKHKRHQIKGKTRHFYFYQFQFLVVFFSTQFNLRYIFEEYT
jgi:hypothetical protein